MTRVKSVGAAGLVILAALLAGGRAAYYIRLDNDGMRYALISTQILLGRGIATPATLSVYPSLFPDPDAFGNTPATWQPPLLPAVYALLGGVRPGRIWPAQAVNLLAHLVTAIASFLIARRLGGDLAGLAAGLFVALSYPLLDLAGHFWTEPLSIAFFTLSVAVLQASRVARSPARLQLCSGLSATAAGAARWTGVGLFPMLLWDACLSSAGRGARAALRAAARTVLIPLAVMAALFTRNYLCTGTLRGESLAPTGRTWGEVAYGVAADSRDLFDLQVPGTRAAAAFALCVVPLLGLILSGSPGRALRGLLREGLDLVLLAALGYLGVIVVMYRVSVPYFEPRIVAPVVPLVLVTVAVLMARGWRAIGERWGARVGSAGFLAALVLIGAAEAGRSFRLLPCTFPGADYGFDIPSCRWALTHCPPGSILVTNAPYMVSFFGGVPTVSPPYRPGCNPFERTPATTEEELVSDMRRIGARYLLLLRITDGLSREEWADYRGGLPAKDWGVCVATLSRGKAVSDKLVKVHECPLGVVYRVRSDS